MYLSNANTFLPRFSPASGRLPRLAIDYISSAPNPARWAQVEKVKRLNSLVASDCRHHDVAFINVFPLMLGSDGLPKPCIYIADRLHMNSSGYAIWKEAVGPFLKVNGDRLHDPSRFDSIRSKPANRSRLAAPGSGTN